jgi:chromosome segregation ATPase
VTRRQTDELISSMSKSSASDDHLAELRSRLAETTERLNKLTSENAKISKQLSLAQESERRLLEESKAAVKYRSKISDLLRNVQDENEKIRKDADERIAAAAASAKEQSDSARKVLAEVQEKIDRFSAEGKKEAEAVALVKEENLSLREQLKKFAEASTLEGKHHEAQVKALSLERQLAEAKHKQAEEQAKLSSEAVTKMQDLLKKAIEDHEAIRATNNTLKQENITLRQENKSLNKNLTELMPLLQSSAASFKELTAMKDEVLKTNTALKADRESLALQLVQEKAKLTKIASLSRTLQQERNDLQAQLDRTSSILEAVLSSLEVFGVAKPAEAAVALPFAPRPSAHGSPDSPGQLAPSMRVNGGGDGDSKGSTTKKDGHVSAEEMAIRIHNVLADLGPLLASVRAEAASAEAASASSAPPS